MSNFRINSKKIMMTLFFLVIINYFTNIETILNEITKIKFETFLICLLIFLPHTLLYITKWFLIVKKFYKKNFTIFVRSMSKAIFLSEITQSAIVLELAKFFYLGKIKSKTKIILILNDKLITLLTRIFILFIGVLFLFISYNSNIYWNYVLTYGSFFFFICLLIFSFILTSRTIIFKIKKIYNKFFSSKIFSRKYVFGLEILRNLQFMVIYYFSLTSFFDYKIVLPFILFIPIFELLVRLQIFSAIGNREFVFLLVGLNIDASSEQLIASSIIITSVTFLTSILNYFIISLFLEGARIKSKIYKKNKCNLKIKKKINIFNKYYTNKSL